MKLFQILLITGWTFALAMSAAGNPVPKGFTVAETSVSPDGRYGVTVPLLSEHEDDEPGTEPKNSLIDVKTGGVLAVIQTQFTAWDRGNHQNLLPARWSPDGSLLLWSMDGKWSMSTLVLLKIDQKKLVWQTDVLKAAQDAILEQTRKAAPQKYAAAKKANEGNGSAFPEGFTVDAAAAEPIALPMQIRVTLTSNPKGIEDFPNLDSHLEGVVDQNGKFIVTGFQFGRGPSIRDQDGKSITHFQGKKGSKPHR